MILSRLLIASLLLNSVSPAFSQTVTAPRAGVQLPGTPVVPLTLQPNLPSASALRLAPASLALPALPVVKAPVAVAAPQASPRAALQAAVESAPAMLKGGEASAKTEAARHFDLSAKPSASDAVEASIPSAPASSGLLPSAPSLAVKTPVPAPRANAPRSAKLGGWLLAGSPLLAALLPAAWALPAALGLAAAAGAYALLRRPEGIEVSRSYLARKRWAALLAAAGVAAFAPRLSEGDRSALLGRFRNHPPKAVIMDYDDTFMDNSSGKGLVVTPERLDLLQRLKAAGIRPIFATNRPLDGGPHGMSNMLMDRMDPALREGFIISVGGGAEVYRYGEKGEKPAAPAFSETPMSLEERGRIQEMMRQASAASGFPSSDWREDGKDHEFTFVLKNDRPAARKLAAEFEKLFKGRFGPEFNVTYKEPPKESLEPYIRIAKATKTRAIEGILKLLAEEGTALKPSEVVIFGDDFTQPGYDSAMARALPGAVVYAVGKDADPRLDNVYLSPVVGPDSTAAFLEDLLRARSGR
ncbi:MAG TPA: hypothetical protein DCM05_04080 [Elusimicrobia bacterium]|nr:hypothetical protein [Elusimicrobiota bacterium]